MEKLLVECILAKYHSENEPPPHLFRLYQNRDYGQTKRWGFSPTCAKDVASIWGRMERNGNVSMKGWRQSHQFGGDGWNDWVNDWDGEWIDDIGMEMNENVSMKGWRQSHQFGGDGWNEWVNDWNGEWINGIGMEKMYMYQWKVEESPINLEVIKKRMEKLLVKCILAECHSENEPPPHLFRLYQNRDYGQTKRWGFSPTCAKDVASIWGRMGDKWRSC